MTTLRPFWQHCTQTCRRPRPRGQPTPRSLGSNQLIVFNVIQRAKAKGQLVRKASPRPTHTRRQRAGLCRRPRASQASATRSSLPSSTKRPGTLSGCSPTVDTAVQHDQGLHSVITPNTGNLLDQGQVACHHREANREYTSSTCISTEISSQPREQISSQPWEQIQHNLGNWRHQHNYH